MEAKYQNLVNWIRESITTGKLKPGDKLSSENELSRDFSLSRQTVRRALDVLEEDGILKRVRGSGTYVQSSQIYDYQNRKRIAIITTYVDGYIFPKTISLTANALSQEGYSVQIYFTNNRINKEKEVLEEIIEKDEVAGVIVEATKSNLPNPNIYLYEKLKDKKLPIIFFNCYYPELKLPHISMNDEMAGGLGTKCLVDNGHRKIGGIFKLDDGQGVRRYKGFIDTLNKYNISISANEIAWVDTVDIENLELSIPKFKQRFSECTGIMCYNDEVAAKLIEGFEKEGIRVPIDKSIVGIDDSAGLINGHVNLTTIPYPAEKLVNAAVENLLELIKNPRFDATKEFSVELVERDSVKRI